MLSASIAFTPAYGQSDLPSLVLPVAPDTAATGLHVSGRQILESNGNAFVMRGINVAHAWYPDNTASSLSDIAKTGANTVRIVLASGERWSKTSESTVSSLIAQAKANKLIAILEVHDTTGYGEQSGAATLSQAVDYWKSIKGALIGQEDYVIINIGNEPFGNGQSASAWTDGHVDAIKSLRDAGLEHALMVDAANWGQDWENIMRDNAAGVLAGDPLKNVIFSVHMYQVYNTASIIDSYISSFLEKNLALVVGEFGADHQGEEVDETSIMSYAKQYGYGYLGWSWSGNSGGVESLDIVQNFDASRLSSWGETLINGMDGIKATSQAATIFVDSTDPTQTPDNQPPNAEITAPKAFISGQAVTLDGSGSSDLDGDTLTYLWNQIEGENITLADHSNPTLYFIAPAVTQPTQYTFELTVNDGELNDQANVTVLVSPVSSAGLCDTAGENNSLMLSCSSGQVITGINFASYGTPGGSCGSFTTGSCNANNSVSVVSDACKGKNNCTVYVSNETFGDPCYGTAKKLSAQVACGIQTDNNPNPNPNTDTDQEG